MLEAELLTGRSEKLGTISGAAISEEALDANAMSFVKVDGLVERLEDTGDFLVGQKGGKAQAGVIVDGDMQRLEAGAWVAHGAIAGGAHTGAREAAQFLDVEVKSLARVIAFVADDGRFWRFEGREAVEAVAAQDARERGLGEGQEREDLGVGSALAAQSEDAGFELAAGLAGLAPWNRGAILETLREAGLLRALEPSADGFLADANKRRP